MLYYSSITFSVWWVKRLHRQYGRIQINLAELLNQRAMSKNKICYLAEMQRSQVNRYCNNDIARLDTDVLARLCAALDCEIGELLVYKPPKV